MFGNAEFAGSLRPLKTTYCRSNINLQERIWGYERSDIIRRSDCSSNFLSTALFLRWTPAATFYACFQPTQNSARRRYTIKVNATRNSTLQRLRSRCGRGHLVDWKASIVSSLYTLALNAKSRRGSCGSLIKFRVGRCIRIPQSGKFPCLSVLKQIGFVTFFN
jgi:hypothetical protein